MVIFLKSSTTTFTNIDILYQSVFQHNHIKILVFEYVKELSKNKNSKKYDEIDNLDWMITWRHYGILKEKLLDNIYLIMEPKQSRSLILSIRDLEVFKLCFNRYRDYFPLVYPPILNIATYYSNLPVLEYLFKENYRSHSQALEYCAQNNNFTILKYLYNVVKQRDITPLTIIYSIRSGNLEMTKFLFEHADPSILDVSQIDRDNMFYSAAGTSNLELFKFIFQRFPQTFVTRTTFKQTMNNKEMFIYLFENCVDYRLAFKEVNGQWETRSPLSAIESLSLMITQDGRLELLKYLIQYDEQNDKELLPFFTQIAHTALRYGHPEIYEYLKQQVKEQQIITLDNISIGSIKGALDSLEKVEYYHQVGGAKITENCIFHSCKNPKSTDVFIYLFENASVKVHESLISHTGHTYTDNLLDQCIVSNNIFALKYLIGRFSHQIGSYSYRKSPLIDDSRVVLEFLFEKYPLNIDDIPNIVQAIYNSVTNNSYQVSTFLFQQLLLLASPGSLLENVVTITAAADENIHRHINLIIRFATTHGRLDFLKFISNYYPLPHDLFYKDGRYNQEVLEFFYEHRLSCPPTALSYAMADGNIAFFEKIIEYFPHLRKCVNDQALASAISNHHEHCVEYLINNYELSPSPLVMNMIGEVGNLSILVYVYRNIKKLADYPNFQFTFNRAIQNGHLSMVKRLYEEQSIGCTLTKDNVKTMIERKHSHLLEYFASANHHHHKEKFDKSMITPPKTPLFLDRDTLLFNQYLQQYILNLKSKKFSLLSFLK